MGFIGMVFEVLSPSIGYLFYPFVAVFLVWSLDRVAKLFYLILECGNACLNECLRLKKGIIFCFLSP